jgi:hypothetical protein
LARRSQISSGVSTKPLDSIANSPRAMHSAGMANERDMTMRPASTISFETYYRDIFDAVGIMNRVAVQSVANVVAVRM